MVDLGMVTADATGAGIGVGLPLALRLEFHPLPVACWAAELNTVFMFMSSVFTPGETLGNNLIDR